MKSPLSAATTRKAARSRRTPAEGRIRPPALAGKAYPAEAADLRRYLGQFLTLPGRTPADGRRPRPTIDRLLAVVSPHIDFHRGGHAYAPAYQQIAERCDADLFIIFGTAHRPMRELFALTRHDFATPLGVVRTDQTFIDRLVDHLDSSLAGRLVEPFRDERVHRSEHSIEFQTVFLRHALAGRRAPRIVPILVGAFDEFFGNGSPAESLEVQSFLAALRAAIAGRRGSVSLIAAADLAHVGPQFGDPQPVARRQLAALEKADERLLGAICRCRPDEFFARVAKDNDRHRICGLSPIYVMLSLLQAGHGEVLAYDQAVAADHSACVSFASVMFTQT